MLYLCAATFVVAVLSLLAKGRSQSILIALAAAGFVAVVIIACRQYGDRFPFIQP